MMNNLSSTVIRMADADLVGSELIEEFNSLASKQGLLPVKVTPHYRALVKKEVSALGQTGGPLYRAVYPTKDKLNVQAGHEVPDFVEDRGNMPSGLDNILIHKYANRALFLLTDKCIGHCMYCFRQDVMQESQAKPSSVFEHRLDSVITYLNATPEIEELILSGGDPMSLPYKYIETTLNRLREETQVKHIRMHTRNLAFAPSLFTDKLAALFAAHNVRLYLHLIHPYEITDEVKAVVGRYKKAGVKIYSQFPILRGINDHVEVLSRLLHDLDEIEAPAINIFIPDPISYSASFRVGTQRLLNLMDELYWATSSWLNGVRLVLDTPIGKVRREDIVKWDKVKGEITFQREGETTIYQDFPEELDMPGEIKFMLWDH